MKLWADSMWTRACHGVQMHPSNSERMNILLSVLIIVKSLNLRCPRPALELLQITYANLLFHHMHIGWVICF